MVLIERKLSFAQSADVRQNGRSMSHETRERGLGTENRRLSGLSY